MINIREARPADAPHLLEIYAPYVEKTAISFEYDVPALEEFEGRISRILCKYPYLVAEKEGRIAGYAYATEFKGREAFRWTVETSVYVERSQRQGGIALPREDGICHGGAFPPLRVEVRPLVRYGVDGETYWLKQHLVLLALGEVLCQKRGKRRGERACTSGASLHAGTAFYAFPGFGLVADGSPSWA